MSNIFENMINAIKRMSKGHLSQEAVDNALADAAAKHREDLDYKHSVVDLLKLLKMDSGLEARQELAIELDYDGPDDVGTAAGNTALHKIIMDKLQSRFLDLPKD